MRHLLTLLDLEPHELKQILRAAATLKRLTAARKAPPILAGRVVGLLFEKPSLRTRVSFESGIARLGGTSLFLGEDVGWGSREAPCDFTRVLGRFVDAVVCRAKNHETVEELAKYDAMHVINGLTDVCHPCQAIADVLTIQEWFNDLHQRHVLFVGDGNNVARSLAEACAMNDMRFTLAAPKGYEFDDAWLNDIRKRFPKGRVEQVRDPMAAVKDADVIYTDVWTSMGQEAEQAKRRSDFAAYQVNSALVKAAPRHVRVLHCLPAVRGEEITDDVLDGPCSSVIDQAENRMHGQNGLLAWLLAPEWVAANASSKST